MWWQKKNNLLDSGSQVIHGDNCKTCSSNRCCLEQTRRKTSIETYFFDDRIAYIQEHKKEPVDRTGENQV
jgi:hypothetical protein